MKKLLLAFSFSLLTFCGWSQNSYNARSIFFSGIDGTLGKDTSTYCLTNSCPKGTMIVATDQNVYIRKTFGWKSIASSSSGVSTATPPLFVSVGNMTIQQSTTSQNGYLSNTDWNTFNNKWSLSNGGTLLGANTVTGSSVNTIKFSFPTLNSTPVDGGGLWLQNNTASIPGGQQQNSPSSVSEGSGTATSPSGSQVLKVRTYVAPFQGVVKPDFTINSDWLTGAGSYTNFMQITPSKISLLGDLNGNNDHATIIEFRRTDAVGHTVLGTGSVGYGGGTEINQFNNLNYTNGAHLYYDSTKNAIWTFLGNSTNEQGIQWMKSGHTNNSTTWLTFSKVVQRVSVIPNSGTGEAQLYGSKYWGQQIELIDDNYVSPDALIKLSATKLIFSGMSQTVHPAAQIGTLAITGSEIGTFQATGAISLLYFQNVDNNTNYNQWNIRKSKVASFSIGAGTKVHQMNYNGGVSTEEWVATATVNGGFSMLEKTWSTTNTGNTFAERMRLNQDGNLLIGTATNNSTLTLNGSFAPVLVSKALSYNATITDHTILVTATGQTITLPTAVGCNGRIYTIKLTSSASTSTVATTSSQTIDGSTTYLLSAQYKYVTVQSDNTNWNIIANN